MGGRPSIVFIFVNKQSQQARKTLLCHYCFQYGGQYMANSRTFAAIYGLFLLLEIAVLTLKHIEKKLIHYISSITHSSSLFRHANCFPHFFLFENKIILVLCPHLFLVNVI